MAKHETLEETFTRELLGQLKKAEEATGISETRLALQAQERGGVAAVKQLLARGQTTRQFEPLQRAGMLKLSMEAVVTRGKFASLFTDDEVNQCLTDLLSGGLYG